MKVFKYNDSVRSKLIELQLEEYEQKKMEDPSIKRSIKNALLDMRVRWNSTYEMIVRGLELKKVYC